MREPSRILALLAAIMLVIGGVPSVAAAEARDRLPANVSVA